jgi:pimeloyl-ACP methyl ester carboxylesterase
MRRFASHRVDLPGGALMRMSRSPSELGDRVVVLGLGGSSMRAAAPRFSASISWMLQQLARELPEFAYAELRYRDRSWRAFGECARDAREALTALPPATPVVLLGFSMGGGIAISVTGDARVRGVIALAPWVPDQVGLAGLRGKRLAVVHGSRDRSLPFIPGVPPAHSRRMLERAQAAGARTSYATIDGAVHAIAVRGPVGLLPLRHAAAWKCAVAEALTQIARGGHPAAADVAHVG